MDIHRTRNVVAISLVVVAIFLILNFIVNSQPIGDWWLPLLLLLLAGLLWFVVGRPRATVETETPTAPVATGVREFLLSAEGEPAPTLTAAVEAPALAAEPTPVIEAAAPLVEPVPVVEAAAETLVVETPNVPEPEPVVEAAPAAEPVVASFAAPAAGEPELAAEPAKPKSRSKKAASAGDDLKRIEGIGPKMEKALNSAGILTFAQLADADEATLRTAIEAGGLRFAPSLPTWAKQSRYLADGDESGFQTYIDSLTAGRPE